MTATIHQFPLNPTQGFTPGVVIARNLNNKTAEYRAEFFRMLCGYLTDKALAELTVTAFDAYKAREDLNNITKKGA